MRPRAHAYRGDPDREHDARKNGDLAAPPSNDPADYYPEEERECVRAKFGECPCAESDGGCGCSIGARDLCTKCELPMPGRRKNR